MELIKSTRAESTQRPTVSSGITRNLRKQLDSNALALKFLASTAFRETLTSSLQDKILRDDSVWSERGGDSLTVLRDLVFERTPTNSSGIKRVSNAIYRLMSDSDYQSLPSEVQTTLEKWYKQTGSKVPTDIICSPILLETRLNDYNVEDDFKISFAKTPPEQLRVNLTSKELVRFVYLDCNHTEERKAESICNSLNKEKQFNCKTCSMIQYSFLNWTESNKDLVLDSGLDLSRLTEDDFHSSANSQRKFIVSYKCCGKPEETSYKSLKNKAKRAAEMAQDAICCNKCNVSVGVFEVMVRTALDSAKNYVNDLDVDIQFTFDSLPNKPYDIVARVGDKLYLIEVDGGDHYKSRSDNDDNDFLRKVEVDRLKTEAALKYAHGFLRIDERGHRGWLTKEVHNALQEIAKGAFSGYKVIGEECPGAALASKELKGSGA